MANPATIRMQGLFILMGLGLVIFADGPARAEDASYLAIDLVRGNEILPAPPGPNNAITLAELAELHRIESIRTPTQIANAQRDDAEEDMFIFETILGPKFRGDSLPLTKHLSDRVKKTEGASSGAPKNAFARVRPYNQDKSLKPVCKTKTKDDSYPSGHTTSGYLMALTLIQIIPEKHDEILARADDYAHNRLICGVHYPSDLVASRLLAYSAHAVIATLPDYQKDLAAARAETRAALGLPAV